MRRQVIEISVNDSGNLDLKSNGNLNAAEVFIALSSECHRLLELITRKGVPLAIPGMLTPDLKRLPSDVSRRLIA